MHFFVSVQVSQKISANIFDQSLQGPSSWLMAQGSLRFCVPFTPTGCPELWDVIKELAAGAKVRLYKPADEPSKSHSGAGARLLKVVSY